MGFGDFFTKILNPVGLGGFGIGDPLVDFGDGGGDGEGGIMTKTIVDKQKAAVSKPLSKYLASRAEALESGEGLRRYEGEVAQPVSPEAERVVTDFLGLSADELFRQQVGDPISKRFREDIFPELKEGYAGALRGSGRFRGEEEAGEEMLSFLAAERSKFVQQVPGQQFDVAEKLRQAQQQVLSKRLEKFALDVDIDSKEVSDIRGYLDQSTSTGTTVLSGLIQPTEGMTNALIGAAGTIGAAAMFASSRDYKENITDNLVDSEELLRGVTIKNFDYKPEMGMDDKRYVGVIAEDAPDILTTKDKKNFDLYSAVGILMDANKKLIARVDELERRVA